MAPIPRHEYFTSLNGIVLSKFLVSGILLSIIGFLFYLLGLALPSWNDFSSETIETYTYRLINIGLWVACSSSVDGVISCASYSATKPVIAARTFSIFTLLFYMVYFVLLVLHLKNRTFKTLLWGAFLSFGIGISTIIYTLIWITQLDATFQYNLSSGFTLTFLSYLCMHVTCILLFIELKTLITQKPKADHEDSAETEINID